MSDAAWVVVGFVVAAVVLSAGAVGALLDNTNPADEQETQP